MTTPTPTTLLLMLCVLCGLTHAQTCDVPNPNKQDCGYVGINQQQCEGKGCCWDPEGSGSSTPWCYFKGSGPSPPPPPPPSPPSPPPPPPPPGSAPFSSAEVKTMRGFFEANIDIQGSGGVVASPDHNTPGGSYYYHWARDGALTMYTLFSTADNASSVDSKMQDYVKWVLKVHGESDPNNIDVRIEPKFNLPNGEPYTGGWCRPQTDGPGLRAITLATYGLHLLQTGQESYVKQYLYTMSSSYNGGAIKYDLDWVVANWEQSSCDLWEEVRSTDFFWNRFTMRRGLYLGATLATKLGDSATAATYNKTANAIGATLEAHYNGQFVEEETNRQKDGATICAFNDGYMGDGVFSPTTKEVAGTIAALNDLFNSTFTINQKDSAQGIPGILYGRYQGDSYAGGNPWVLTSGALAQLYYRGASEVLEQNKLPTIDDMKAWRQVFGEDELSSQPSVLEFARALATKGDGVLIRIRAHTISNGLHMPEQLDRNTGAIASATDLTWSYATILKAMHQRGTTEQLFALRQAEREFPQAM
eukprot:m.26619 g.26619  ORF g.26619 m.26619 type:complete len:532 (+) comp13794_c0_seq1:72-1667(+)